MQSNMLGNPHFVDTDVDTLGIDIEKLEDYLKKYNKKKW